MFAEIVITTTTTTTMEGKMPRKMAEGARKRPRPPETLAGDSRLSTKCYRTKNRVTSGRSRTDAGYMYWVVVAVDRHFVRPDVST